MIDAAVASTGSTNGRGSVSLRGDGLRNHHPKESRAFLFSSSFFLHHPKESRAFLFSFSSFLLPLTPSVHHPPLSTSPTPTGAGGRQPARSFSGTLARPHRSPSHQRRHHLPPPPPPSVAISSSTLAPVQPPSPTGRSAIGAPPRPPPLSGQPAAVGPLSMAGRE